MGEGPAVFNDHVHFNFDGDYLVAQAFFPSVVAALGLSNGQAPANSGSDQGRMRPVAGIYGLGRSQRGRGRGEVDGPTALPGSAGA